MNLKHGIKYSTTATLIAVLTTGCFHDSDNDSNNDDDTDTGTGSDTGTGTSNLPNWLINNEEASLVLQENGSGILVNVQSATEETVNNVAYARVNASGIPDYAVTVDQDILDGLNFRPKAATDFADGQTTAELFDIIEFGQDIGYINNPQQNCADSLGYGYWPPGPECPTNQS